jgi:DNA-binding XRE family transcriptional regulator
MCIELGMTKTEMSKYLDVSIKTLTNWEKNGPPQIVERWYNAEKRAQRLESLEDAIVGVMLQHHRE